ncbi:MAG: heavy metal translocating P-type ATPase [Desulfovibrio sp.]|jgi:Cd2+/Zn2+-exporting ATPase|nr:heavy metal translocating P-type ATPase [Desulfovibrio sp.]
MTPSSALAGHAARCVSRSRPAATETEAACLPLPEEHCACNDARPAFSCACCADTPPSLLREADAGEREKGRLRLKKEILFLAASALAFFAALAFGDSLEAALKAPVLPVIYAALYLFCGARVFRQAGKLLLEKDFFNEFTLMGGATLTAILLGDMAEAVGVMLFYRTGEFLQERASDGSRRSIKSLLASKPGLAHVLQGTSVTDMAVESVPPGQRVLVLAGEKIPLDGEVLAGESQVDQSPLTGEFLAVDIRPGDSVLGGTINLTGALTVKASGAFADTHMARILELVEHAAQAKSPTERFITRFARFYTPAVVVLALLTALLPPLLAPGAAWETWIYRALVLLVISCPCALLISIPLGYFGGIGGASRLGILVKGGAVLDGLLKVKAVFLDKTGTLTRGVFQVLEILPAPGADRDDLLALAAWIESHSNHPAARSIVRHALGGEDGRLPPPPEILGGAEGIAVREIPGKGLVVEAGGSRYLAGSSALLADFGLKAEDRPHPGALVHIARDADYLGCVLLSDTMRQETLRAVADLKAAGLRTYLLTGDREEAAAWAARTAGLDGYRAGLLPEDKVAALRELADPATSAFVGDGINDAPILALSRVGIAMGGVGAEAAIEAADAVILNDSPAAIPRLFRIARKVRVIVLQNIILALGVKTAFMGLGIAGISGLWEAVFADVGVALLAVLNAARATARSGS